ncbi:MAG: DUF362 domain-containing protein [Polyangiales bacterium]
MSTIDRRHFLGTVAAGSAALTAGSELLAQNRPAAPEATAATPPAGFTPMTTPGRVVRVNKPGSLRPGGLYPKPDDARAMVNKVVMELSGRNDLAQAWRAFVHPNDRVAIKVNGLGLRNMASNKEVVEAIAEGLVAAGVPAAQITMYDQWDSFLASTRVNARGLPLGRSDHVPQRRGSRPRRASPRVAPGTRSRSSKPPAVIGVPLVKDHSLCGFTGALKNMTHGSIKNPEAFHRHLCRPQIAELFAHDAIRSRSRLHIMDAFKAVYHGGPRDSPEHRAPVEAVLASTDPVALDRIGAEMVDQLRTQNHMGTLQARGLPPRYIDVAGTMGLGVADRARITLQTVNLT